MTSVKHQIQGILPPNRFVTRNLQRNIFHSEAPPTTRMDPLNIDVMAENVRLPFASYIDQKRIRNERNVTAINKSLDKEIF